MFNINPKLLEWIGKNRVMAIMLILVAGNVYQYIDYKNYEGQIRKESQEIYNKSIEYERKRSEKLELLLTKLLNKKVKNDEVSSNE